MWFKELEGLGDTAKNLGAAADRILYGFQVFGTKTDGKFAAEATGAIRAIRDLGRRVPEDVSVVGYDGVPISDYLVPRLGGGGRPHRRPPWNTGRARTGSPQRGGPAAPCAPGSPKGGGS